MSSANYDVLDYNNQRHDEDHGKIGIGLIKRDVRCPECGGTDFVTDRDVGETFCANCGYVKEPELLSTRPEWRAFKQEEYEERTRVGPFGSQLITDKGSTFDVPIRGIGEERRNTFGRMKRWGIRARLKESKERNIKQAVNELRKLGDKLKLPEPIIEEGAYIYKKFLKEDLVKGRSIDASAAASLYAACRYNQIPRTLKEVAGHSNRDKKEIARTYRLLLRELDIKMPVPGAESYISKIASGLYKKVSMNAQNLSADILKIAGDYGLTAGKDPKALATTALYVACREMGEKRTQKELAKAGNTTEVTVRNRLREWEEKQLPIDEIAMPYVV